MLKKLIMSWCLLAPHSISVLAFGTTSHLETLRSKFPYGLLSDDYGILSVNDLAINACDAKPVPFSHSSNNYSYQYWQCFESKNISFNCDRNWEPDEYEGALGLVTVKTIINHIHHEYIERRLWPIADCKNFLKNVRALIKGNRYTCLSGSFIGNETDRKGHQSISWIFERIKTKKGCEGHDCEFSKKLKQSPCSNLKL